MPSNSEGVSLRGPTASSWRSSCSAGSCGRGFLQAPGTFRAGHPSAKSAAGEPPRQFRLSKPVRHRFGPRSVAASALRQLNRAGCQAFKVGELRRQPSTVHSTVGHARCIPEAGLTLPSRGRPTSGFASCRPPLMSNVRRPDHANKDERAIACGDHVGDDLARPCCRPSPYVHSGRMDRSQESSRYWWLHDVRLRSIR